jgi:hypothetical protein
MVLEGHRILGKGPDVRQLQMPSQRPENAIGPKLVNDDEEYVELFV